MIYLAFESAKSISNPGQSWQLASIIILGDQWHVIVITCADLNHSCIAKMTIDKHIHLWNSNTAHHERPTITSLSSRLLQTGTLLRICRLSTQNTVTLRHIAVRCHSSHVWPVLDFGLVSFSTLETHNFKECLRRIHGIIEEKTWNSKLIICAITTSGTCWIIKLNHILSIVTRIQVLVSFVWDASHNLMAFKIREIFRP